jgi:lipoprotein-anchoring transpeptidase ErfK/SrfK
MQRWACALVFLAMMAGEASAQSRSWIPWAEIGSGPSYGRGYGSSGRGDGSVFGSSGSVPFRPSSVKYPPFLEGGPRPNISPSAPPQVAFRGTQTAGSVVIDTQGRALYYVLAGGKAYRYPISVGREGFTWRGTETITRVQSWPDWRPPAEMRQRDPNLPELMSGGLNNPLGAKALYLGNSLYRIHGTNDARTIGYAASSGCFRMMNHHVVHLSTMAGVGTTVHVLDRLPRNVAEAKPAVRLAEAE